MHCKVSNDSSVGAATPPLCFDGLSGRVGAGIGSPAWLPRHNRVRLARHRPDTGQIACRQRRGARSKRRESLADFTLPTSGDAFGGAALMALTVQAKKCTAVIRRQAMVQSRSHQQGAVLLGVAGGMLLVSSGLLAGYFFVGNHGEAQAATTHQAQGAEPIRVEPVGKPTDGAPVTKHAGDAPLALAAYLQREVELATAQGPTKLTWAALGATVDPDELAAAKGDLAALAAKGSLPIRIDRDRASKALLAIKASHDTSPVNAYLDLEERKIYDDKPGLGLDVWASLSRLEAGARQAAAKIELVNVSVPAVVTKQVLGIDDISIVLGHHLTKFPVTDRDRNFNLKLAASKLNGVVLPPDVEWSFNQQVGERSEKEGYKIAHV